MDSKRPERLEQLADKTLLTSGTKYRGGTLRTERDLSRHIQRQKQLAQNAHLNGNFLDERDTSPAEEKLFENEMQRKLEDLLVDVLSLFSSDPIARKVLAVGLMMDCYENTKIIARAARLSENTVKTAKQRIKYKLPDSLRKELKSILDDRKEVR